MSAKGAGGGDQKVRRRSKHEGKSKKKKKSTDNTACSPTGPVRPVFGVPLDIALARDPSHDGVPLPAFFRHCIDYVEQYGLSTEGLYRIPGVNSQVLALIAHMDRGVPFAQIAPTSLAYDPSPLAAAKRTTPYLSQSRTAGSAFTCVDRGIGCGAAAIKSKHAHSGNGPSPYRFHVAAEKRSNPVTHTTITAAPNPPHDVAVITSVIKHFLRNLPDPILSQGHRVQLESLPFDSPHPQVHLMVAQLIHRELPRSHRFLLAWLLQHFSHVIDRAGENLMNLANLSIVLSPCLGISPQLLAVLLRPAPPDVQIDLLQLDPSLTPVSRAAAESIDPSTLHWLFPHPDYRLRPYHPPLKVTASDHDLPESEAEVDTELSKQQSLLSHLYSLLRQGEVSVEIDNSIWDTQRLVTELKRRKSLNNPDKLRAELSRQQVELDRLHQMMIAHREEPNTSSSAGSRRRGHHSSDKSGKTKPSPTTSSSVIFDELLAVQRRVTRLKRRLKRMESRTSQQPQQQLPTDPWRHATMAGGGPALDHAGSASVSLPAGSSIPLVIPTLAELDEEEVLNLALRKLPSNTQALLSASPPPDDLATVPVQMPPPDVRLQRPPSTSLAADELQADLDYLPNQQQSPKTIQLAHVSACELLPRVSSSSSATAVVAASSEHVPPPPLETAVDPVETVSEQPSPQTRTSEPPSPALVHCATPNQTKPGPMNHQLAFHTALKQELLAVQTDLLTRVDSEKADISRIQSQVLDLLQSSDPHQKRVFQDQIGALLAWAPIEVATNGSTSLFPHVSGKAWTRLADECQRALSRAKTRRQPDDRSNSSSDGYVDVDEDEEDVDPTVENEDSMAYTRLAEDEEEEDGEQASDRGASRRMVNNEPGDDVSEAELAHQLYQLILENARLEESNYRYVEGIQTERNRCTELKVLLKLRDSGTPSNPATVAPVETPTLGTTVTTTT